MINAVVKNRQFWHTYISSTGMYIMNFVVDQIIGNFRNEVTACTDDTQISLYPRDRLYYQLQICNLDRNHGSGQGALFCTLCLEVDHMWAQCALLCLNSPPTWSPIPSTAGTTCRADNICMSWNRGACIFPGICAYQHVSPASLHTMQGQRLPTDPQKLDLQTATHSPAAIGGDPTCTTHHASLLAKVVGDTDSL